MQDGTHGVAHFSDSLCKLVNLCGDGGYPIGLPSCELSQGFLHDFSDSVMQKGQICIWYVSDIGLVNLLPLAIWESQRVFIFLLLHGVLAPLFSGLLDAQIFTYSGVI